MRFTSKWNTRFLGTCLRTSSSLFHQCIIAIKLHDMRTNITVDDDVYEAALHLSRASGERLGKALSDLIRKGLASVAPPPRGSTPVSYLRCAGRGSGDSRVAD